MHEPGVSGPQKLWWQKSHVKTMLIAFFDSHGMIRTKFVPLGQTVNAADFYKRVLNQLLKQITHVRPDLHASKAWSCCAIMRPCITPSSFGSFQPKRTSLCCTPLPYSPDLAPADYFLFWRLKIHLKGHRFDDVSVIQKAVTRARQFRSLTSPTPQISWLIAPSSVSMREGCILNKIYLFCHSVLLSFFFRASVLKLSCHAVQAYIISIDSQFGLKFFQV